MGEKDRQERLPYIVLAGNPNVGKSTVFNALTGMRQHTGNWPGKTVATASGLMKTPKRICRVADIPGTYSLFPHSEEERVARDSITLDHPDAVAVVCDATNLERNLNLVLQTLGITKNVVVCVNLMDEARKKGIHVDVKKLEEMLHVPVVGVTARRKRSLLPLLQAIDTVLDHPAKNSAASAAHAIMEEENRRAEEIARAAVRYEKEDHMKRDRAIDRFLTGRRTGYPVLLLLLALVFFLTLRGANAPSAWLGKVLFSFEEVLANFLCSMGLQNHIVGALCAGMYRVLAWVVSVMLPPMAIFFPLFTLLEDAGFLPRVAFMMDKSFQRCRACGKQALTMCMGFGCNAAGVVGCRIIDSPRERLIAVLTNAFVPCNGRFPMLVLLLMMFFVSGSGLLSSVYAALALTLCVLLSIACTFFASFLLSRTTLKGLPSAFTLELPPYRRPQILRVLVRSVFDRTLFVLGRAVSVAAPAGLVIYLLANVTAGGVPLLTRCAAFLDPLGRFFGLDGVILMAFLLGFPANEIVFPLMVMIYTATGQLQALGDTNALRGLLIQNGWTYVTAACVTIFTLFHWPCSTTLLTIKKETGKWRHVLSAALWPTAFGLALCLAVRLFAALFGG